MTETLDYPVAQHQSAYRWYLLTLGVLTNALVIAMPSMCMPVLFPQISAELNLNLVQVGLIWGISALPGIFVVLPGGALGDRIGPRKMLLASCLLSGITGALRGFAVDFYTLAAAMFLFGLASSMIVMNNMKMVGTWFSSRQLGVASGFLSMGMALGFLLTSLLSATWLAPLLGGWRQVLYFYGGVSLLLALPWLFARGGQARNPTLAAPGSLSAMVGHVARLRNVWLLGLTLFGISGSVQGTLGYLPLFLRNLGWAPATADGALATFHTISMLCVMPIALGSDRLGTRKKVLLTAGGMMVLGMALLSTATPGLIWTAVALAGMVRDGFMAVYMTSIIETDGVGPLYAGTATGFVLIFSGVGNLIAPSLGNSLAELGAGLPFLFWAGLAALGLVGALLSKEKPPALG